MINGNSTIYNFLLIIFIITINLGINPVNGGIPANDNIDIINIILLINLFLNELYILLIDF